MSLEEPLLGLPGAGPVTARRLAAQGLQTVGELLLRLPRAYDDLRRETSPAEASSLPDGATVLVRGVVRRVHVFPRRLLDVVVERDGASLRARWFRPAPGMSKGFSKGAEVALAGPLRTARDGTRELVHPTNVTAALASSPAGLGLRPRYPAVEGVAARVVERLVAGALARFAASPVEVLPPAVCARLALPALLDALRAIHAPPADLDAAALDELRGQRSPAHRRLALERLVVVQAAFLARRAREGEGGGPPPVSEARARETLARVRGALGFALTGAQERAVGEIARDLAGARPMQRLLVGDVGSGKTAVALAAAALVAAAGGQTLLMAPTEVLAEQHARSLGPVAERLGFRVGVLTAGVPAEGRRAVLADAASGAVALVIGTQAVLERALVFADLHLVVVDEQHRFGVTQRARARRRGDGSAPLPHLLVLSATPIPRTLALARHGDLDASLLDERPAGRRAPSAVVCRGADEARAAYERLRDEIGRGRQAFVVCAVRERARRAGAVTALGRFADLRRRLAPARVGLLHGALAATEKEDVLRAFAAGGLDVLVATTVIELGIDVPNATLMIIEEAERFGLAQLHQLRGRVGRGDAPGLCFLCTSEPGKQDEQDEKDEKGEDIGQPTSAARRLDALAATEDGFRLAELDLEARGFGDLFGTRQTGGAGDGATLRETFALVELARREAEAILAADPGLSRAEHAPLSRAAAALEARPLFDEEAG